MSRIAVVGPGAIGLCVGAALVASGHEVVFAARSEFNSVQVGHEGEAGQVFTASVVTQPRPQPAFDWVMLCVKAHQVATAVEWIAVLCGPGTHLCVLQNGVEHVERVAPFTGEGVSVVPVVVDIPATRLSPGVARWRSHAWLDVSDSQEGKAFSDLFSGSFISVRSLADLKTRMWRKLCVNAPGGAILALTGKTMGVFHEPGIADMARTILGECVSVGRAEGADLPPSVVDEQMQNFMSARPDDSNSMLADRLAGVETEWDARNAVIVRKGRLHGIATPVSDLIVPLLAAQSPR